MIKKKTLTEKLQEPTGSKKDDRFLQNFFVTELFSYPDLRDYLQLLISKILNVPLEEVQDGFELLSNNIGESIDNKDSETDLIAKTNNFIVNIEVNYNANHRISNIKNFTYMCSVTIGRLNPGDAYSDLIPIRQINLNNYDQLGVGEFIYRSKFTDEKYHIVRDNLQSIVDVNVAMLRDLGYTEVSKTEDNSLERMLYLFACADRETLKKLYEGNEMMERVVKRAFKLDEGILKYLRYDRRELERQNDFAEGRFLEQSKLIKTLYKNGMNPEEISKMTEIPLENINSVIKRKSN